MGQDLLFTLTSYMLILIVLAKWLGNCMTPLVFDRPLKGTVILERWLFKYCKIVDKEMNWLQYFTAMMVFNLLGGLILFLVLRFQASLPLNPQHLGNLSWHLSLNTAISFMTNTNWQAYAGETTLSYFSAMVGLTVQNFLSAATGIAILFALLRGLIRQQTMQLGNAFRDLTRITLFILLPLSFVIALLLVSQGVIQNISPYQRFMTLQGQDQLLPGGPVASQEAIKLLGSNGGGFFNANSAHPFENPTGMSNWIEMLSMLLIPAALCFTFGNVVRDRKQGTAILWVMSLLFISAVLLLAWTESRGGPNWGRIGADSLLNMEGKESRFGLVGSTLFTVITSASSCGAVNAMLDSFTPLGGLIPLWLIQLGEVVFGGVGSGLYGLLIHVMLAVFIAGLMIGRTPHYLGKKIGLQEMKMAALFLLITPCLILVGTALAISLPAGTVAIANPGAHGFTEILYAMSSVANNNGSAFAGLSVTSLFWDLLTAIMMLAGRFLPFIPLLYLAHIQAGRKIQPMSAASLNTTSPLFIVMILGVILLMGALTFIPPLALGPLIEHLQLTHGQ